MFSIHSSQTASLCDGLTRREWLHIGGLGSLGLSLPQLLQSRAEAAPQKKFKSCIVLFFLGAPPQQETWDPKPDSAVEYRGDLKPIASATPGLWVGELMPKVAQWTKQIAVLRAVQTRDNAHSSSGYYMTTGHAHAPTNVENQKPGAPNDWPSLGAIVRHLNAKQGQLPAAITLPEQAANDGNILWPGQDAGFLGRSQDPWLLHIDPAQTDFQIEGLSLPKEIPSLRLEERKQLLQQVEHHFQQVERSHALAHHSAYSQQAFDLISSPQARKAFRLEEEDPKLRDRYGRTRFGQSVLLARRLVEAGVPLIRVNWTRVAGALNNGHWDTHAENTNALKQLMPMMDQTYSALLEDLTNRGLLEDTLVVWMGEFGRTPKFNPAAGRDHWGHVFSVALAGGGVRGGTIYGASDKIAAYPKDGRVTPEDLQATIFHLLGHDPNTEIQDTLGRPFPISRGEVIQGIL